MSIGPDPRTVPASYAAAMTPQGMRMVCGWFATCTNPTDRAISHPHLGPVPICPRCASEVGVTPELDITVTVEITPETIPAAGRLHRLVPEITPEETVTSEGDRS
jgi:hypothetical protein